MHAPRSLALVALAICGLLASCAAPAPQSGPGPLASIRIPATPLKISQAAVDVLSRFSYSVSSAQYPVAMNFEKTGNSPDFLATTDPATLVLSIHGEGAESEVTFTSLVGRFNTAQLKNVLEKIKAEALAP